MQFKNLKTTIEDGILIITIDREEKLNALNKALIQELDKVFSVAQKQKDVKAIILTGAGQKAFVAGADIAELKKLSVKQAKASTKYGQKVFKQIENCSKPVVAAVNGFALGGGCELAMACHLRIASENAKFGQPEVNLGLIPGYGGTQRLTQYIGKTKSMELHMSGAIIDASEALRMGLVNYVVSQTELISKCKALLQTIISKSPSAVSAVIRTINAYYEKKDGFVKEQDEFSKCFGTADFKEGVSAFLEKRKPDFKGK